MAFEKTALRKIQEAIDAGEFDNLPNAGEKLDLDAYFAMPAHLRSLGASVMLTSDLVANVIVGAFFLTILNALGGAGAFAVFGVIAILAFFFVVWLAPETKGRPLEDIGRYWENGGRW